MPQKLITQTKQKILRGAHAHSRTHVHNHDYSVVGLSKSEEVFCLKGGLRQRGSSPSLFNACSGGGGGAQRDRDVRVVGWWRDGWMTGRALRNNYLHKIPSPFSFL